jgi:glycosyltransferase involved in cell wall biosynthesis
MGVKACVCKTYEIMPSQPIKSIPGENPSIRIDEKDTVSGQQVYVHDDGSMSPIKKLSIIIPAYNEEKTISLILNRVKDVKLINNIEKEIIVVNDCSTDNTASVLDEYISLHPDLNIIQTDHGKNQGKGAAIHTGIAMATGEYLLVQDADLEYDPSEYNMLLKPIIIGAADVVYGSRFMGGNPHRILFFWHSIGNTVLTIFSNMFSNLNLTDMETGYKVFRTSIIQQIYLKEKRFGFEPEVTIKIAMIPGIRIYEVGISYYGRTYQEGKKIGWKDGVRTIFCILKYGLFNNQLVVKEPARVTAVH